MQRESLWNDLFGDSEPEPEQVWEIISEASVAPTTVPVETVVPRTQASARAVSAVTGYRRLRRVGESSSASASSGGAAASSDFRPLPWEVGGEPTSGHSGAHLLRPVRATPSVVAAASSDAVPVVRAAGAQPKAKPTPRRVAGEVRFYAVSSVSENARGLSVVRPGIYCGLWFDLELLLPRRRLVGSGVSLQGFGTIDLAFEHLLPPSPRRAFKHRGEVPFIDRDRLAELIRDSAADPA
jgi:hypothetical protein